MFEKLIGLTKIIGLLIVASLALQHARAEEWGDMGYSQPSPQVEPLPESITEELAATEVVANPAPNEEQAAPATAVAPTSAKPSRSSITSISTVKNTYGVMTEENQALSFYFAPFAGITSLFGNESVNSTAKYAAGVNAGVLISNNMLLELGYTHSEQDLSQPIGPGAIMNAGTGRMDAYVMKRNGFDGGAKLFILGREDRLRPFVGGGLGYASISMSGNPNYFGPNSYVYDIRQFTAFGEIGAEFAITKGFIATAMFKMDGVLSSNASTERNNAVSNDPSLDLAGNSLSRTASYTFGAGVGIYF